MMASLPLSLRQSTFQRLAFVSETILGALVVSEGIHWLQVFINHDSPVWPNCAMRLFLISLTILTRSNLRNEWLAPGRKLLLARIWIAFCSLGIVFMEFRSLPEGAALAAAGISRGCIPVILAPVLIPDSLRRSLRFSASLLLAFPLGYLLSVATGGQLQSLAQVWVRVSNDAIVLIAAWATAATVHQLRQAVAEKYGSYELVRMLGKGGFGEVWEARHRLLQRPAALKLVNPELARDSTQMARFMREAETLSGLTCPHTVHLFDYGLSEDGRIYLAMELLSGVDLEQLVTEYGPLPPERVASFLSQVCLSLEEAHAKGLIHRDIKPANLFVCQAGLQHDFIKVLDFGMVKKTQTDTNLTQTDQVLGTPAYMAPEQIMGQACDGRSDLYSLGCVGYYLLTGQPPFVAEPPMQVMLEHLQTKPPELSLRLGKTLNHPVEKVIMTCLAKEPGDRPATAALLFSQLRSMPLWDEQQSAAWWQQIKR